MAKPATLDSYSDQYTVDCERVLVTLLRGLGPWKDSVYLIGGLTPRYLVAARPPMVPAHAGTLDVDRKDGPVSVAKFELGEGNEPQQREARALRRIHPTKRTARQTRCPID
jgi:hypothetical protein